MAYLRDGCEAFVDEQLPAQCGLVRSAALEVELEHQAVTVVDAVQVHLTSKHPEKHLAEAEGVADGAAKQHSHEGAVVVRLVLEDLSKNKKNEMVSQGEEEDEMKMMMKNVREK